MLELALVDSFFKVITDYDPGIVYLQLPQL